MFDYETFMELKRQQNLGVSGRKIAVNLNITRSAVEKWWNKTEQDFLEYLKNKGVALDNYREFILSILKIYPQIKATNLYYRIVEQFPDFECRRSTFYRYLDGLKKQTGYAKFNERMIAPREQLPPGYEAQADFGQYKMQNMYGGVTRVYFFAMVLSYSQMRFAYFSADPFTTKTAIEAHEYAYRYFGGRTVTNMYDLDRVFVVNENYGNIIFVKEFENYVKEIGLSTTMCRPRDPRTKGRVENLIGYVKLSFLDGRVYNGIDSLNFACLNWLDREGNGRVNNATRKIPREMFIEESKYLIPVKPNVLRKDKVFSVTNTNSILYEHNKYAMPKGKLHAKDRVRVELSDDMIVFYKAESNEFLCKYKKLDGVGGVATLNEDYADKVSVIYKGWQSN